MPVNQGISGCNVGQQQLVYSTQGFTSSFPNSRLILNQSDPSSNAINSQQNWQQVILSPFPSQQQTLPVQQTHPQQIQLQHQQNVQLQLQPVQHLQHQQIQFQPQQQISPRHPVHLQIQAPHQIQIQPHLQPNTQGGGSIHNHQHLQQLQPTQLQLQQPTMQPQQIVIQSQQLQHSQNGETLILPQGTFINNMGSDTSRMKFHQVFTSDNMQYAIPTTQTVHTTKAGTTTTQYQTMQFQPTFTVAYPTNHQQTTTVTMVPMTVSSAPMTILKPSIVTGYSQVSSPGIGVKSGKLMQPKKVAADVSPGGTVKTDTKLENSEKISVPWSWSRIVNLEGKIVYLSPGGNELRSVEDVKNYLLKTGTCKCGLVCPLFVDKVFNFDPQVKSEPSIVNLGPPDPSRYCFHQTRTASMYKWENHSATNKVIHVRYQPPVKNYRKHNRKKRPLSGILTQAMIDAREFEKKRINEIILQQKREFESTESFTTTVTADTKATTIDIGEDEEEDDDDEVQFIEERKVTRSSPTKLPSPIQISPSPSASSPSQKKISTPLPSPSLSPSVSKNNAIRQLSGTNEGNQILNDAWDSPEKEQKGNTPLDMVEGIVANLQVMSELVPLQPTPKKARKTHQPSIEPPAWVTTPRRPLLSSQIQRPNFTPPAPTESMGSHRMPQSAPALIPASSGMLSVNPPMMQLVNTVNGPMLVPEGTQLQPVNQDLSTANAKSKSPNQAPPKLLIPSSQCGQPVLVSPGHQLIAIASAQSRDNTNHQQQQIIINQGPSLLSASPMILSNGVVTMPTQSGIMYNQITNGSLLQVPNGQTLLTSQIPVIMNSAQGTNNGQLLPSPTSPGGMLLLSPSGGVIQMQPGGTYQQSGTNLVTLGQGPLLSTAEISSQMLPSSPMVHCVNDRSKDIIKKQGLTSTQVSVGHQSVDFSDDDEPLYASNDDESTEEDTEGESSKQPKSKSGNSSLIQSNQVDSSGLEATPPHAWEEGETKSKSKTKQSSEGNATTSENKKDGFMPGELVWGPLRTFASWPGKIMSIEDDPESKENAKTQVFWFGSREVSEVKMTQLKSLSEGLEEHHKERKKLRKGRKMNSGLEMAIHEAMSELDRMGDN